MTKPTSLLRALRIAIGLGAGAAVGVLAAWILGVDRHAVARYVAGVSPWVVIACVASSFVVLALQALRWHMVMRPLLGLRYSQAFRAQVVGLMFNAVLPARGGDLLRVQYLGRRTGKSRATIFGTEVIDRWLDWWGWFPVLFVLSITGGLPSWIYTALGLFGALLVAVALAMLLLTRRGYKAKHGSRFARAYGSFQIGIESFKTQRTLLVALLVAPLPWLWEAMILRWTGHAFGIDLTLAMAFSVLIGFNVAMVVPSPGSVGSVEAGGMAALVFFGVDQSKAMAFMFVYHFTQLLPGIASGVAVLVAEGEGLFGVADDDRTASAASAPIAPGSTRAEPETVARTGEA